MYSMILSCCSLIATNNVKRVKVVKSWRLEWAKTKTGDKFELCSQEKTNIHMSLVNDFPGVSQFFLTLDNINFYDMYILYCILLFIFAISTFLHIVQYCYFCLISFLFNSVCTSNIICGHCYKLHFAWFIIRLSTWVYCIQHTTHNTQYFVLIDYNDHNHE